ncbi:MAG: fructosamine kinase family protein [Candidatus Sumerlaeota bacterium]
MNLPADIISQVAAGLSTELRRVVTIGSAMPLASGTFNNPCRITTNHGIFFLKWSSIPGDCFAREAEGLQAIAAVGRIRTPHVILANASLLLTEYVEQGRRPADFFEKFGHAFAMFHRAGRADRHGFANNNSIGGTPQLNDWCDDWVTFFRERRLRYQVDLAVQNGYEQVRMPGERILDHLERLIPHDGEPPTLLHGDLWSGNFLCSTAGEPILIDPACYHGHREADVAMARLFGGFPPEFHRAYEEEWPLSAGHQERADIYNLYHLLNHLNLFGSGYLGQCLDIMRRVARVA